MVSRYCVSEDAFFSPAVEEQQALVAFHAELLNAWHSINCCYVDKSCDTNWHTETLVNERKGTI